MVSSLILISNIILLNHYYLIIILLFISEQMTTPMIDPNFSNVFSTTNQSRKVFLGGLAQNVSEGKYNHNLIIMKIYFKFS